MIILIYHYCVKPVFICYLCFETVCWNLADGPRCDTSILSHSDLTLEEGMGYGVLVLMYREVLLAPYYF